MLDQIFDILRGVALASMGAWLIITGIRRRRTEWSRREWARFAYQIGIACAVVLIALAMAGAVDRGIYDSMPSQYHKAYFTLLMTLTLVGGGGMGLVLARFAKGP